MINLCIDVGNTLTKVAVFDDNKMIHFENLTIGIQERMKELADMYHAGQVIFSSVGKEEHHIADDLGRIVPKVIVLTASTPVPVENRYETPETLGKDRLAAVTGAHYLYPGTDLLVIDAGTAITYDIINHKGEYLGGNISPGIQMRFRALNDYTSRLPLIRPHHDYPLFGKNTADAIRVGVQSGVVSEIDGTINQYREIFPDLKVIITGGDIKYFDNKLKNFIFVISNLVMIGLNRILIYNAQPI